MYFYKTSLEIVLASTEKKKFHTSAIRYNAVLKNCIDIFFKKILPVSNWSNRKYETMIRQKKNW